ncbi:MAG: hypothetical protein ACI9OJ_000439, partial [Myxococcota bacterium]
MTERQMRWAPWIALFVGVTALHLPALIGGTYFLDVYLTEVHPHFVAIGTALQNGELPFWTSDIMLGYPLAANPQVGTFYPPHLLGLWVLDPHIVLTFSAWLHGLLAAAGAYLLARRAGAGRIGGVVAGLAYSLSPFFVFYHMAIHGLIALAYLPIILWTTTIATERGGTRYWALGALLLAAQMYAGHLQFVMYTLIATVPVAWCSWDGELSLRERVVVAGKCVGQGVVALLIYAPQLLPAFELWRHSLRRSMSAADVVAAMDVEALSLDDMVEAFLPRFFGGPSFRDFWYPEFVGVGLVVAALVAITRLRSSPQVRLYGGLTGVAILYLALVQLPVVGEWVVSIPILSAFRAPGRIFCWILLSLSILAGVGIDRIRESARLVPTMLVVGLAVGLAATFGAFSAIGPRDPELDLTLVAELRRSDGFLLCASSIMCLGGWWLARRASTGRASLIATVVVAVSIVAPIALVGGRYNPTLHTIDDAPTAEAIPKGSRILGVSAGDAAYMASVPGPLGWPYANQSLAERAGWSLVANVGMAHGLANLHGQTSLPLSRFIERMFGDTSALGYPFQTHPNYAQNLLAHVGVTHVVGAKGGQMPVNPRPTFEREAGNYQIHRIAARPRARFYPLANVHGATTRESAMSAVQRDGAVNNSI